MDPLAQLEHTLPDRTQTSKAYRVDARPTTTLPDPMALDSKTDLRQRTASTTHTSIETRHDPPTTQSPTKSNNKTTNNPTNKTLPAEVWMRIFDHIHTNDDYARHTVLRIYKTSLLLHGDTAEAAKPLPAFEKRTWTHSRALYHIDRSSRAAALKLKLSLRLLRECKPAILALDTTAKVERQLIDGTYAETTQPCYVAILVSEQREVMAGYREAGAVVDCLTGRYDDVVVHSLGLGTAKRVVLLERCEWDSFSMLARAREMEGAIHGFWRRNGIPARVVEIA